jgi:hypothetical protein
LKRASLFGDDVTWESLDMMRFMPGGKVLFEITSMVSLVVNRVTPGMTPRMLMYTRRSASK